MSTTGVTANVSTSQTTVLGERQSSATTSASASAPSSSRWIFTHEQLMRVPSIREGMSPEEVKSFHHYFNVDFFSITVLLTLIFNLEHDCLK